MNLTSAVEPSPFLEYPSLPNSHKARHIAVTYEPFYCSQVANSVLRISANEHGDRETQTETIAMLSEPVIPSCHSASKLPG